MASRKARCAIAASPYQEKHWSTYRLLTGKDAYQIV